MFRYYDLISQKLKISLSISSQIRIFEKLLPLITHASRYCYGMLKCFEYHCKLDQTNSVPRQLLCSFRPTFEYGDDCWEIMERLVEEKISLILCVALGKENLCWSQSDTESVSWSVDELPKLKTHLLHCSTAVIEYWLCDSVAVPMGMISIFLHLTKLPTQYQFVSVVCHVYRTDTFWFLYANLCW